MCAWVYMCMYVTHSCSHLHVVNPISSFLHRRAEAAGAGILIVHLYIHISSVVLSCVISRVNYLLAEHGD